MIWDSKFEEVDTFESFVKNVIKKNDVLVIPYINIGISNHPLNPTVDHLNINMAYIVCVNACINRINGKQTSECLSNSNYKQIDLGGVDVDNEKHLEFEILCEKCFLQTLPVSEIRKEHWIPIATPNYPANMVPEQVQNFFNHLYMPDNISKLIK